MPEQALGWFPLGLGLVMEDEPSELSCIEQWSLCALLYLWKLKMGIRGLSVQKCCLTAYHLRHGNYPSLYCIIVNQLECVHLGSNSCVCVCYWSG